MQKVLMVAFHYPPYQGGSGVHRTLKFSRYLLDYGWSPVILSARARAYPQVGEEQLREIPAQIVVERAFALDTAKSLSFKGRYLRLMALPDQWASWWFCAVTSGLRLIREHRPSILWSTYPIATAHLIGLTLHRLTGLPWIADFRDSMTEDNYPRDIWSRRAFLWIERRVVKYAVRLVFTTESTRGMYLARYPNLAPERALLLPNGYDEDDFNGLSELTPRLEQTPVRLLHAGVIYTDDRDPRAFFKALARLKGEGKISARTVNIDLRASGSEAYFAKIISQYDIDDIVRLLPALSHRQALQDCADADGLILIQAASCNHQIPAKVYEYFRLGRPILALTPAEGDTGKLVHEVSGGTVMDLADEDTLYRRFPEFLDSVRHNSHSLPDRQQARKYARRYQAAQLSRHMFECLEPAGRQ